MVLTAPTSVLITPAGQVEWLTRGETPSMALGSQKLYNTTLNAGLKLFWSSNEALIDQVNELATQIVGFPVTGDVFVVALTSCPHGLQQWLLRYRRKLAGMGYIAGPKHVPGTRKRSKVPKGRVLSDVHSLLSMRNSSAHMPEPTHSDNAQIAQQKAAIGCQGLEKDPAGAPGAPLLSIGCSSMGTVYNNSKTVGLHVDSAKIHSSRIRTSTSTDAGSTVSIQQSTGARADEATLVGRAAAAEAHHVFGKHAWITGPSKRAQGVPSGDLEGAPVQDPRQALLWSIAGRATSMSWSETHTNSSSKSSTSTNSTNSKNSSVIAAHCAAGKRAGQNDAVVGVQQANRENSVGIQRVSENSNRISATGGEKQRDTATPRQRATAVTQPGWGKSAPAGQTDGQTDGHTEGQTEGQTDVFGQTTSTHAPVDPPLQQGMVTEQGPGGALGAPGADTGPGAPGPLAEGVWRDLAPEILGLVVEKLENVPDVQAMASVCSSWRTSILSDPYHLQQLDFAIRMPRTEHRTGPQGPLGGAARAPVLPQLLQRACLHGNASANVVAALVMDAKRFPEEAIRFHKAAARKGDAVGQVVLGMAYYSGTRGMARDAEEALMWLSKGAKQLQGALGPLLGPLVGPSIPVSAPGAEMMLTPDASGNADTQHTAATAAVATTAVSDASAWIGGADTATAGGFSSSTATGHTTGSHTVGRTNAVEGSSNNTGSTETVPGSGGTVGSTNAVAGSSNMAGTRVSVGIVSAANLTYSVNVSPSWSVNHWHVPEQAALAFQNRCTGLLQVDGQTGPGAPAGPVRALCLPGRKQMWRCGELFGWLAASALLLGYLHMDGEATRVDISEAMKWFKLAAQCGSRDAEMVLGMLYNTGQYA